MIAARLIDGRLKCVEAEPSFWLGGYGYDGSGSLCITRSAPTAGSVANGGPLQTPSGRVHVSYNAVAGAAGGIPVDSAGRMAISEWGTIASGVSGLPTTAEGAVVVDSSSFRLSFADLGSGQVSLVPDQGGVAATFTRATTATTVNSAGTVVSVASGVARSYYDPTTLAYLGYLAEGARTNLFLQSADPNNAAWTKTDTTVSNDAAISPDGTQNADRLTEGTAGTANVSQTVTATADANYAVTRFVKYDGTAAWLRLCLVNGVNFTNSWFNIQTGVAGATAVGGTGAVVSSSIKAYPNGWYRIEAVGSVGSGATAISSFTASANADNSTTRVNNATRLEWGAQFENNVSFASSYIPTTSATVTRNADVLTYPVTGWFNAAQGTFFGQITPLNTANGTIVAVDDTTDQEFITLLAAATTLNGQMLVVDGGAAQASFSTANAGAVGATSKEACSYAANDFAAVLNGGTVATDTAGTLPTVTRLTVGVPRPSGSAQLFSPIRRIAYWATILSSAQKQQLTS